MPPKKEQWKPAGKSPDDKLKALSDGSESNATSRDTDGKPKKKPQAGNKGGKSNKDKLRRTQSDGQVGKNGNKKSSRSNKDNDKPWYGSPYDPRTDGLIVVEMRNPYDIGPIGPHRIVQIPASQHAIDILGVYDAPRRPVTQTQVIGIVDVVRPAPQIVEVVPVFRPAPQIVEVVEYVPVPRAATYPVYNSWSDPYNYYTGDTYYY